ncbi:single-stranded DNA-binding protein [uncultured Rothia sp.]|uniref:single-stranded DNA-binding protein n=1 Tax=uncultured Rothia sp. TaxID=316088 RepID=UPI003216459F
MAELNIHGWIAREPELRWTNSGKPVLSFAIPENHKRKNEQGQWEDTGETTWREVAVWRDAEFYAQNLHKGDEVLIVGSEKLEVSENNGQKYHRLKVTPKMITRVLRAPKQGGGFGGNQQQSGFQKSNQQNGNYSGQQPPAQPPAADPWGAQSGGNYNWGDQQQDNGQDAPPF